MNAQPENMSAERAGQQLSEVVNRAGEVILGKQHALRLAISCLLAKGHLLIEDQPGVGKTTLAKVLAKSLGLSMQRIQFTSDLLPADILGASIYNRETGSFHFQPGPVFTQVVLADEVNRATPRAQSALLEAMEEQQVTIEGETRTLPSPFFVIATQNPSNQVGTFALPESQLDRFMMRLQLGYPQQDAERELLQGQDRRQILEKLPVSLAPAELMAFQELVPAVVVADPLLDYIQGLLNHSRRSTEFSNGLSPRCGLALLHCAQSWALLHGRDHVIPDDVQAVLPHIIGHRLKLSAESIEDSASTTAADQLISQVPIP